MREKAMIARPALQKANHQREPAERLLPRDPAPLGANDDGHGSKSGAAGRDEIGRHFLFEASSVACKPAGGMRPLPKEAECLALDEIKERLIRQTCPEIHVQKSSSIRGFESGPQVKEPRLSAFRR